jgi:hypothetical protein
LGDGSVPNGKPKEIRTSKEFLEVGMLPAVTEHEQSGDIGRGFPPLLLFPQERVVLPLPPFLFFVTHLPCERQTRGQKEFNQRSLANLRFARAEDHLPLTVQRFP